MSGVGQRLRRLAMVGLVPSSIDVVLLVGLRQGLGWILVVADLVSVVVASTVSYLLHRAVTFRSDPYVRWVQLPAAFAGVATLATIVDVVVLRALYAASGFDTTAGLVEAKLVALGAATVLRLILYRGYLLVGLTRARQVKEPRPPAPGAMRFSVIVPSYNEADRIGLTIPELRRALHDVDDNGGLEIVVVDDGSSDRTADEALEAGADQVVVQPHNQGKGAAVRIGVMASRGRCIAFTDADLSYAPEQLLRILKQVEDGWDVAIGDRGHPAAQTIVAGSRLRAFGSRIINLLGYAVLLGNWRDTQCGLKGFRSDIGRFVFARLRIDGFAFDIELLHLVERYEFSLVEVPVEVSHSSRSTVRIGRDAVGLVRDLFRIRHLAATGAYEVDTAELEGLAPPSLH